MRKQIDFSAHVGARLRVFPSSSATFVFSITNGESYQKLYLIKADGSILSTFLAAPDVTLHHTITSAGRMELWSGNGEFSVAVSSNVDFEVITNPFATAHRPEFEDPDFLKETVDDTDLTWDSDKVLCDGSNQYV